MQQAREELARLETEAQEKRNRLQQSGAADTVLRDDEVCVKHLLFHDSTHQWKRNASTVV